MRLRPKCGKGARTPSIWLKLQGDSADNLPMAHPSLRGFVLLACLVPATVIGCGSSAQRARQADSRAEVGLASYYAHRFHGRETAYGETYDERALTAAHRSLPPGTRVRVTNLKNGREVIVRINDRGPQSPNRLIDLSFAAAEKLRFVQQGLARVRIEVLAQAE